MLYKLYQGYQAIAPMRHLEHDLAVNPIVVEHQDSDHSDYMPAAADPAMVSASTAGETLAPPAE
ncbi:MAG: hypothetical protein JSS76_03700 [Bacteroidetes bacterium]|nr:hypothetical protein [Bacteroidota bacterium]